MQFRTQIPIKKNSLPISYDSNIVSLGSCFAVNMGQKLEYYKFRNTINPFGILFHPFAIEKIISFALNKKTFSKADIFFHNELWHCFDAHSDLSSTDAESLINSLNTASLLLNEAVKSASHIIITLGTAWVYKHNEINETVANCHKVPQKEFTKELLNPERIKQSLQNSINMIREVNSNVQVIFTVSPVRHIKDGFTENQWSKANLISAIQNFIEQESSEYITYFPSYEIMMDELRDYRFYNEDMIHPNQTAINYIWQRFTESFINESCHKTMEDVASIQKSLLHRPFNPKSEQHKKFITKLNDKINVLQEQYPYITFKKMIHA